jgi:tumor protein p53-inducible protein 3
VWQLFILFVGTLIIIGFLSGATAEKVNLSSILRNRLNIRGSTLRARYRLLDPLFVSSCEYSCCRSLVYKIKLTEDFAKFAEGKFESSALRPLIAKVYDWKDVIAAHEFLEANANIGKVVLTGM